MRLSLAGPLVRGHKNHAQFEVQRSQVLPARWRWRGRGRHANTQNNTKPPAHNTWLFEAAVEASRWKGMPPSPPPPQALGVAAAPLLPTCSCKQHRVESMGVRINGGNALPCAPYTRLTPCCRCCCRR